MKKSSVLLAFLVVGLCLLAATPSAAQQTFNVRDAGAVGDGKALDTKALQQSLDACGQAGGGVVLLPAGTYLSEPLTIRTRTTVRLEKGATLLATSEHEPFVRTDKPDAFHPFLGGKDLEDVTIEGEGVIDGAGQSWWEAAEAARQKQSGYTLPRPNLIILTRVKNLTVRGVTIQNAPKFHFVPTECDGVLVENATFLAPERAPNTDAIDPSMCTNVTVRNCVIDVGDDNIAVKSGKRADGREFAALGLLVENCTFKHGHGMSIGSEVVGGVKDVTVRNCTFDGTENGIRIKTDRKKGGTIENLLCENITMTNVVGAITITMYYPKIPATDEAQEVTETTPHYRNITIRNLTVTSTEDAGVIIGLPESPIENVLLENVMITSERAGLEIRNAKGVTLKNVLIKPAKGDAVIQKNAEVDMTQASLDLLPFLRDELSGFGIEMPSSNESGPRHAATLVRDEAGLILTTSKQAFPAAKSFLNSVLGLPEFEHGETMIFRADKCSTTVMVAPEGGELKVIVLHYEDSGIRQKIADAQTSAIAKELSSAPETPPSQ